MTEATITVEDSNGVKIAHFSGQLDESNVDEKIKEIYKALDQVPSAMKMVFDMTGLEYLNSKSIGYLTDLYGKITEGGGSVKIAGARPNILDILQVVGLTQLIETYDSVDLAKNSMLSTQAQPQEVTPTSQVQAAPVVMAPEPVIQATVAPVEVAQEPIVPAQVMPAPVEVAQEPIVPAQVMPAPVEVAPEPIVPAEVMPAPVEVAPEPIVPAEVMPAPVEVVPEPIVQAPIAPVEVAPEPIVPAEAVPMPTAEPEVPAEMPAEGTYKFG